MDIEKIKKEFEEKFLWLYKIFDNIEFYLNYADITFSIKGYIYHIFIFYKDRRIVFEGSIDINFDTNWNSETMDYMLQKTKKVYDIINFLDKNKEDLLKFIDEYIAAIIIN